MADPRLVITPSSSAPKGTFRNPVVELYERADTLLTKMSGVYSVDEKGNQITLPMVELRNRFGDTTYSLRGAGKGLFQVQIEKKGETPQVLFMSQDGRLGSLTALGEAPLNNVDVGGKIGTALMMLEIRLKREHPTTPQLRRPASPGGSSR